MTPVRIFLVDDHALMRQGLASLLGTRKDIEVIGDAESGEAAIRKAPLLKPDVIIMDLIMPSMDGAEATRQLKQLLPGTQVLILTSFGTADGIAQALDAGASGAILKTVKLPALAEAIRTVASGGTAISPEIRQMLEKSTPIPPLSPRQSEILESVVRGLTNKDIAKLLGISAPMVNEHLNTLFAKIGAANRTEAVAIALRKHLLKI